MGIGCHHKLLSLECHQIVFPHQPQHPLVIHYHPQLMVQLKPYSPVSVTPAMLHYDLLDYRPHHHLFFVPTLLGKAAVVSCPAYHRHLAHLLHTQTPRCLAFFQLAAALHTHYFLDLVVDSAPPAPFPAAGPFAASPDPDAPATAPVPGDPLPTPVPLPLNSLLPAPSLPQTATRVSWHLSNSPLA